ncbi:MAG: poly-gamma-glutamate synthase PgsB [Fusobacteriaceae bacterium]
METVVLSLIFIYFISIFYEKIQVDKNRKKIKTIIHVNGIRGKSTVSRLIDAGLRDGNRKVFTKVTGTSPRYIDIDGVEKEIVRKGKANIREQIKILKKVSKDNIDVLVLECMAVNPDLQRVCEEKILKADIGVITNVREDHLDEMGDSLEKIAYSLSKMIPKNKVLFTSEVNCFNILKNESEKRGSIAYYAQAKDEYSEIDFKENVALALSVCKELGVDEESALERMKNYKRDIGVLREINFKNKKEKNITFINALAANDPNSSKKIIDSYKVNLKWKNKRYLMINNRRDRASRMLQYVDFVKKYGEEFNGIFVSGQSKEIFLKLLKDYEGRVEVLHSIKSFEELEDDSIIFAVGNICGIGQKIIDSIESRDIKYE